MMAYLSPRRNRILCLIEEMVRSIGETSNTEEAPEELFETLKEWSEYLNKEDIDIERVIRRPKKTRSPTRGPSPC